MKRLLPTLVYTLILSVNILCANDVVYECRPDELINTDNGETINEITDRKTAVYLTVSKNKIFDGTYNYNLNKSKKYHEGIVQIFKDPQSGNLIFFPTFLIEENIEVDVYQVLFQYSDKPIGLYLNCFNLQQVKAYRAKQHQ